MKWVGQKLLTNVGSTSCKPAQIADCKSDIIQCALNTKLTSSPPQTYSASSLHGHVTCVSSQDDILPALQSLYGDIRIARAIHNICAYILGAPDKNSIMQHEYDGE